MSLSDLIFALLANLLLMFSDRLEEKPTKYYSCPEYCGVIHTHIGVESEEKKTNEQGPLPDDKWIAYDDEPTDASDNDDIGSSE